MGIARSATQRLLKSRALIWGTTLMGWLRLDRLSETAWRWARRQRIRMLTPQEIHEAEQVFGLSIPYERVRVVEASPFAVRIAALSGRVHLEQTQRLAVTVFHTIHFSSELAPDLGDMPWLMHELTHVWQYCHYGPRYLADSLKAQAEFGHEAYDIEQGLAEGWPWERFNAEQQGDIAREYYKALRDEGDASRFRPYADVLRQVAA